ncbi:MAG TPA: hypothetical protein P5230_04380 [Candidatus Magasanikbacteria bacterium]|nr:hypothetical protein [Candidatus Magasanikbacteria bacterium]
MDKQKLILPVSILFGFLILGTFIYISQVNKQNSIEKQQRVQLQEEKQQQDLKNTIEELKLKQENCKSLSSGVMKKWNNVMGVTYDNDFWKECVVTYTDTETGEVNTSPLSAMKDSNK